MTPAAASSRRSRPSSGRPSACRRMTSSRRTPSPNRSVRPHSPPIERAASSIVHIRPPSSRTSACTGPSRRPTAAAADATRLSTDACAASGSRDGRHVDRLLEVGALERVRLVEDGERLHSAGAEQPLDGDLDAGHVLLEQERRGRVVARRGDDLADPALGRARESASSARMTPRPIASPVGLEDGRESDGGHVAAGRQLGEAGLGDAGGRERPAKRELVARPAGGVGWVGRQAEPGRSERGRDDPAVVGRHDGVERQVARELDDRVRRPLGPAQIDAERVADRLAAIGRDHHLDVERGGGGEEVLGAVAGRRQDQERAPHVGTLRVWRRS